MACCEKSGAGALQYGAAAFLLLLAVNAVAGETEETILFKPKRSPTRSLAAEQRRLDRYSEGTWEAVGGDPSDPDAGYKFRATTATGGSSRSSSGW